MTDFLRVPFQAALAIVRQASGVNPANDPDPMRDYELADRLMRAPVRPHGPDLSDLLARSILKGEGRCEMCGNAEFELCCPFGCYGLVDEDHQTCWKCREMVEPVERCTDCGETREWKREN